MCRFQKSDHACNSCTELSIVIIYNSFMSAICLCSCSLLARPFRGESEGVLCGVRVQNAFSGTGKPFRKKGEGSPRQEEQRGLRTAARRGPYALPATKLSERCPCIKKNNTKKKRLLNLSHSFTIFHDLSTSFTISVFLNSFPFFFVMHVSSREFAAPQWRP